MLNKYWNQLDQLKSKMYVSELFYKFSTPGNCGDNYLRNIFNIFSRSVADNQTPAPCFAAKNSILIK